MFLCFTEQVVKIWRPVNVKLTMSFERTLPRNNKIYSQKHVILRCMFFFLICIEFFLIYITIFSAYLSILFILFVNK